MEVCPYCKKPFKRLKSHLPHCKATRASVPADHRAQQSKLATRPHATERKRPITDLNATKERESETKSEKRNTKLVTDKPERTMKSFPLQADALGRARITGAGEDLRNRVQCSLNMLTDPEPKLAFQGETKAQFFASETTTPKTELAKGLPPSGKSRRKLSETKASLPLGPGEPSSHEDRKCSSALPDDVQTTSPRLDRIDPLRQKLLVNLLDTANGDFRSSPMNLRYGVERARTSLTSSEAESKAKDPLSEVPSDVRDPERQEKGTESQFSDFKVSPGGETHARENQGEGLDLGAEARGSTGNVEKSASVTDMQDRGASLSSDAKDFSGDNSATRKKGRDEGPDFSVFSPRETTCSELLSVSPSHNQNPASLAARFVQEGKAEACRPRRVPGMNTFSERGERSPPQHGPSCGPQQSFRSVLRHASDGPFSQVAVAGRKGLSGSLGLEWFPELYPGYLGLGVLPGRPQYWKAVAQKPQLIGPQEERHSQVPLLERSWPALRSWGPPTRLPTSSLSLMRLLGAVQKGWVRCRATVRSGVGGVTMLFAGYLVLWCSWSFRHLKLQRWRK
ncbi:uncharacterized protein C17orf80 homolog isoform X1 [Suricata suricatta]|uniref:Sperm-expressed protein 1 n=1 Tax=Suricata suricatta TaxID=37032 RepID=A0A673VC22_SURSU|nr:uncharacterized protein C17orf80 homolog isoform X1 [Suricata suricatta]XP_029784490.1 uncharacterized protein C17orf80 homolog isoform X1 [Suricata suricatta]XP_029784491.1 uncharacterized protein C17orf80 homolog isoform X1 [Suricata suricatta]